MSLWNDLRKERDEQHRIHALLESDDFKLV